jgi:hypothetical protein
MEEQLTPEIIIESLRNSFFKETGLDVAYHIGNYADWLENKIVDYRLLPSNDIVGEGKRVEEGIQTCKQCGVFVFTADANYCINGHPVPKECHKETIQCTECDEIQEAQVEHTTPYYTYVHKCVKCGYTIMESEWNTVPSTPPVKVDEGKAEELQGVLEELAQVHNLLAKSPLTHPKYQPISGLMVSIKTKLFDLYTASQNQSSNK